MARILNACPVTIELARLAAQVREHAPFCGPERTYIRALLDFGRAVSAEYPEAQYWGIDANIGEQMRRDGLALSEKFTNALHAALAWDWCSRTGHTSPEFIASLERDAIANLMTSPEWHDWIAQRGAATGDDLTPEARAENEWRTRVVIRSNWRSVTRLT